MILAGDLGGTKSLLGLFAPPDESRLRPRPIVVHHYTTADFRDLTAMIAAFVEQPAVRGHEVTRACFGIAGPVMGRTAALTNAALTIDADAVGRAFAIAQVTLLNDLVAMAWSMRVLNDDELMVLHHGQAAADGNLALIAAGTGVNEALLLRDGERFIASAAESGHADWAARNDREVRLLRHLIDRFGRAEIEHVVSGLGIAHIHGAMHDTPCAIVDDVADREAPARISEAAAARRCPGCVETMEVFVDAYGAEAGNLALRTMATGGIFIGGGIAPKILPLLTDGRFMRAFLDKGRFRDLLSNIPVRVILNEQTCLLGAAVAAGSR